MSRYLLLAWEAIGTISITVLPKTVVMGLAASDVDSSNMGCEIITRRECFGAFSPFASMSA